MSHITFTQRFGALLLTNFLFFLFIPRPSLAQAASQEEVSIRLFVEKYFAAYEKKDLNELLKLWSEKSPDLASNKKALQELFATAQKIEIKALVIGKIFPDAEKAQARLGVEIMAIDVKSGKPMEGFGKMNRTIHLIKESGEWKIWQNLSSEEVLATKLVEAKTEAERKQLLEADKELVTVVLVRTLLVQGALIYAQPRNSQTLAIYGLAGEIANQLDDKKSTIIALRRIGNVYYSQSNYTQALDYYQKSLKIAEEIDDKDGISSALNNIGNTYQMESNYPQALEYQQRGLKIREEIGDKKRISTSLNNIGSIYRLQSNYPQALEYHQKSLKIAEEIGDKDGITGALNNIGSIYRLQSNYPQALEYHQKSLKIAEEIGNKNEICSVLNNIGNIHLFQGTYAQALDYYQRGLKIAEEIGNKNVIGSTLNNIGNIYRFESNYPQALEYHQKSLKIAEEIGNKNEMSSALNNIGNIHLFQGTYTQALDYYQRTLKIKEEIGDKTGIGNVLNNIGNLYYLQDNYTQALDYYQRTLKIKEEVGEKLGISDALHNIGTIRYLQNDYPQALEYHQRSLKIMEEIGNKLGISNALNNVGTIRYLQNDYAQALEYHQRSLKIKEEISDKTGISKTLNNIGAVYQSQGFFQHAIEVAKRAANIAEQVGSRNYFVDAHTLAGNSYQALNQPEQAKKAFTKAISEIEETRNQIVGGEQQQQQFFAGKLSPYYGMVSLLIGQNNTTDAFAFAERAKARALLDVLQTGKLNITRAMSPAEKQQEQQFNSQIVLLNTQIYKEKLNPQQDQARLNDLNAKLQKARLEMEAFQTSLYAAHPELKIQRGQAQTITLSEAAAIIPDAKTALLEFVVSADQTYLFALSKSASQSTPDLNVYKIDIKQKELAKLCSEFRQHLGNRHISYQNIAMKLYDLLLKPVRAQLPGKSNLIIIPDGVLWELPFQALQPVRNHFLIEDYAISYAPSLTVLQKMIKTRKRNTTPATTLLAVGNPIIGAETSARLKATLMDDQLLPLPEAERQVKLLQKLYTPSRSKVYIGQAAGEAKVKAEAGNSRILHLATHGILNDASPMYSQIVLAYNEADTNEDGLLEAWEIMNLELNADLVVLSACDTARGKLGAGEGMIGLSWALFVAGSPATVVSQWKVESASTTELMVAFHKNLQTATGKQRLKMTKAEAMRRAALKLLKTPNYRHPFYWAAFVVIGDAS
jgi:CHAT domain-containing protein/Tfp pilus assembly protein PilF